MEEKKEESKQPEPNPPIVVGPLGAVQLFRTFLTGINEVGIATVLLIVFLLMYMGVLPSGVSQAFDKLAKEHIEIIEVKNRGFADLQKLMTDQQNIQLRLIRQICRNTAKNDTQAIECDR